VALKSTQLGWIVHLRWFGETTNVKTKVLVGTSLQKQPHGRQRKWKANSKMKFGKNTGSI
jgi:hypothetical protein